MLLTVFPTCRIPVVAATACLVPFLLDPAAALGRMSPWHMKLQWLGPVAAFLLGVSSAVCTRQPPTASVSAHLRLPAWSSAHARLLAGPRRKLMTLYRMLSCSTVFSNVV